MKICIGIPNGGELKSRLLTDVFAAIGMTPGVSWLIANMEGTLGPRNRWLAGMQAIEQHCDYLWLVDCDMAIPPEALPRLLSHNKDIIGAAYNYRRLPLCSTVKMLDEHGEIIIADASTFPKEPFTCYAIGSGCKLIKTSALMKIPQPWFALEWNKDGDLSKTDDVWFCAQAHSVGLDVWCDPTIPVKHIGNFLY